MGLITYPLKSPWSSQLCLEKNPNSLPWFSSPWRLGQVPSFFLYFEHSFRCYLCLKHSSKILLWLHSIRRWNMTSNQLQKIGLLTSSYSTFICSKLLTLSKKYLTNLLLVVFPSSTEFKLHGSKVLVCFIHGYMPSIQNSLNSRH